jgi:Domain of unknown function (DUF4158)
MVAAQLQVQPALWDEYAQRDETRREHLIELQHLYGFEPFTSKKYREIAQALIPLADQTHQAMVLVRSVIDQLRSKQVIVPPLSVIERLCAEAITRAERRLYRKLISGLDDFQRTAPTTFHGRRAAAPSEMGSGVWRWTEMPERSPASPKSFDCQMAPETFTWSGGRKGRRSTRTAAARNVSSVTIRVFGKGANIAAHVSGLPHPWSGLAVFSRAGRRKCFWKRVKSSGITEALNDFFIRKGIGWQLVDGAIVTRGAEAFEETVKAARRTLQEGGRPTASKHIHEALQDLSRRPAPDLPGAIFDATGCLECVARDVTGNEKPLSGRHFEETKGPGSTSARHGAWKGVGLRLEWGAACRGRAGIEEGGSGAAGRARVDGGDVFKQEIR